MRDEELLDGWIPYRMFADTEGVVQFRWLYAGHHAFTEPFFGESISACLSLPQNVPGSFPVTGAETLLRVAALADSVPITAFVYHISRCGSTLLSQLLVCDEENIVLSEVPLLDEVLRMKQQDHSSEHLFRAVLKLLSRKRTGKEQRVFVKTDSWHVLFYEQLHAWYADAPSFLMYRHPKEVGKSQANHPAMHSVPGVLDAALFGLREEETAEMTRETYLDHVLSCYFKKYSEILHSGSPAVTLNYHDGPMNMMEKIFTTCEFLPSEEVRNNMQQRSGFHSKNPQQNFAGDTHAVNAAGDFPQSTQLFSELEQLVAAQKTQRV